MYLIICNGLNNITTDDYRTARIIAQALYKDYDRNVKIYELINTLDGSPEWLKVLDYNDK